MVDTVAKQLVILVTVNTKNKQKMTSRRKKPLSALEKIVSECYLRLYVLKWYTGNNVPHNALSVINSERFCISLAPALILLKT